MFLVHDGFRDALGNCSCIALPPAFPTWMWGMQILQEQISAHAVVPILHVMTLNFSDFFSDRFVSSFRHHALNIMTLYLDKGIVADFELNEIIIQINDLAQNAS